MNAGPWWKANLKASGPLPAPQSGHAKTNGVMLIYSSKKTQIATKLKLLVPFTTPDPSIKFDRDLFITF